MNNRTLGWSELRKQIGHADLGFICPVEGCRTRLKDRQRRTFSREDCFKCVEHGVYFSPSTFEYEHEATNILWEFDELTAHVVSKRESRVARDNSEDALTWNVFRFMEQPSANGLLSAYLSRIAGAPQGKAKAVFWSYDREAKSTWQPLVAARREFELNPAKGSEPDLIVLTDRCLFVIEAKVTAPNNTKPRNPKSREKYVSGGGRWWSRAFVPGADYAQIAERAEKYELMRFWLLGTWMAQRLGVDFRLVNLLREQDESEADIEGRFRQYLPAERRTAFVRQTWEDIGRFVTAEAPPLAEKDRLLGYLRNKTIGYRGGVLQRAFATIE